VIRPVQGRRAFGRFRTDGRRARRGPLTVTYVAVPDQDVVRVAYAIGTAVGSAVTRNRLRRRLRHILDAAGPADLAPGNYLIHATPPAAGLSYEELSSTVMGALEALRAHR
jgi:ribonuclease P protein component